GPRGEGKVELTLDMLRPYMKGQVEVLSDGGTTRHRCQINNIRIEDDHLCLDFDYICVWNDGRGEDNDRPGYVPAPNQPARISLALCVPTEWPGGRFVINLPIAGEMMMFYLPTHYKRVLADGSM